MAKRDLISQQFKRLIVVTLEASQARPGGRREVTHACENEVVETAETRYGTRYVVDGPVIAPDGTTLNVRSAWYIDPDSDVPRFVTAHPLPKL
jgi:uncharacterized protein DUF6883